MYVGTYTCSAEVDAEVEKYAFLLTRPLLQTVMFPVSVSTRPMLSLRDMYVRVKERGTERQVVLH